MTATLLPSGPRAVLVECEPHGVQAVSVALRAVAGVSTVVPGATTVLVEHDGSPDVARRLEAALGTIDPNVHAPAGRAVTIEVRYDGDDLAEVAAQVGMTIDEVIALHSGAEYSVAFCGFAPGFAYLTGLPAALAAVPRRSTPRTRVPAGSVALAAGYSAVYPSASPGGWHLLGRTSAVLWDPTADEPALLTPGTTVRFEVVS